MVQVNMVGMGSVWDRKVGWVISVLPGMEYEVGFFGGYSTHLRL
jgi:hypothetical protein